MRSAVTYPVGPCTTENNQYVMCRILHPWDKCEDMKRKLDACVAAHKQKFKSSK